MAKETSISWTTYTFNPWWGCEKVSPACAHCYAETWALRCGWNGKAGTNPLKEGKPAIWGGDKTARRFFGDAHWREPRRWDTEAALTISAKNREPGSLARPRVFCASMADVFEDRDDLTPHRARLFRLIHETPDLDWLLLTKRPKNWRKHLLDVVAYWGAHEGGGEAGPAMCRWLFNEDPPANVWMGCTVEDQKHADSRIPDLLKIPASRRFLSMEPLLGPVDLHSDKIRVETWRVGETFDGPAPLSGINWVIVGGESGKAGQRRPFEIDWLLDIEKQCDAAGVALHVKQDAGGSSGLQGRIPDRLWARKEFPRMAEA